jgi:hypothetical protein
MTYEREDWGCGRGEWVEESERKNKEQRDERCLGKSILN